jgi:hypothetical protein
MNITWTRAKHDLGPNMEFMWIAAGDTYRNKCALTIKIFMNINRIFNAN